MGLEKVAKHLERRKTRPNEASDPRRAAIWDNETGRWVPIQHSEADVEAEARKHEKADVEREVERLREQRAKQEVGE